MFQYLYSVLIISQIALMEMILLPQNNAAMDVESKTLSEFCNNV